MRGCTKTELEQGNDSLIERYLNITEFVTDASTIKKSIHMLFLS